MIPIYNEESTVVELIERLRASVPQASLIFVDNASTDQTLELLGRETDIQLVRHSRNLGYGQSLVDGIRAGKGECVVVIDADLEYRPEDVPLILEALQNHPVVYGSRFLTATRRPADISRTRLTGNRLVTGLFNGLYGQRLTDLYTGIRGFRREVLEDSYRCTGFEWVLEVSARLARRGVRLREVPVEYQARTAGSSKMRHIPEFLKFAWWLIRLRVAR